MKQLQRSRSVNAARLLQRVLDIKTNKDLKPSERILRQSLERNRSQKGNNLAYKTNLAKVNHYNERQWLKHHGKKGCIPISEEERILIRDFFQYLDETNIGYVHILDFVQPLMSMGLVHGRDEFYSLVKRKLPEKMECLEMHDLIYLVQTCTKIRTLFQKLLKSNKDSHLPLGLVFQQNRRKHLMNACTSPSSHRRQKGMEVLQAYQHEKNQAEKPELPSLDITKKFSTLIYKAPKAMVSVCSQKALSRVQSSLKRVRSPQSLQSSTAVASPKFKAFLTIRN